MSQIKELHVIEKIALVLSIATSALLLYWIPTQIAQAKRDKEKSDKQGA